MDYYKKPKLYVLVFIGALLFTYHNIGANAAGMTSMSTLSQGQIERIRIQYNTLIRTNTNTALTISRLGKRRESIMNSLRQERITTMQKTNLLRQLDIVNNRITLLYKRVVETRSKIAALTELIRSEGISISGTTVHANTGTASGTTQQQVDGSGSGDHTAPVTQSPVNTNNNQSGSANNATTTGTITQPISIVQGTFSVNGILFTNLSCARENQVCTFSGARNVAYGVLGSFNIGTFENSVLCNNQNFGDPIHGTAKSCYVSINTATGTVTNNGGSSATNTNTSTNTNTAPVESTTNPSPSGSTTSPIQNGIQASMLATRLSGPAPLAVLFDATNSSSSGINGFHDLLYEFNFGDISSGSWEFSGQSKNTQIGGPLAAHVFENPGTYTVTVRVRNPVTNQSSLASIQIVVTNPSTHYSGTRTICVSTTANYSGCPDGAIRQSTLPSIFRGNRVLLRRGESFPSIYIRNQDDDVQVGSFGSGPKARVQSVDIGEGRPRTAEFPDEITIMDLDIANGISQTSSVSRILLLRNDLDDPGALVRNQIDIGAGIHYWAVTDPHKFIPTSAFYQPREIFIVENRVIGSTEGDDMPSGNFFGNASRLVLLGNDMGRASQHTVRIFQAHKTVIAHNALRGMSSDAARHALKLHSGGFGDYHDNYAISLDDWKSSEIVISNNLFGDPNDNNYWTVAIRPQNSGGESGEGIEDVILENNRFHRGPNTNSDIILVGRRMTTRGNTRATSGLLNISAHSDNSSYPLLPIEWRGPYFIR